LQQTCPPEAYVKQLKDKVAVITGAASGFGREFALLCAQEGMRLALTDVDDKGLRETVGLLPADTQSLAVNCNVGNAKEVEQLAEKTFTQFGAAHLLFNNAGVGVAGPAWSATLEDWKWVLDVNVMGVVHGIRSFVPRMLEQGDECHVVNTASVAGLLSVPGSSVYCVSKHAVVTLSECLYQDLRQAKASIGVSVLCPAYVNTGIADSARNRPAALAATNPMAAAYEERIRQATRAGRLSATDIARATLEAVKSDHFYILTHPAIKRAVEMRMQDIIEERSPANPMP
jgi:NAD(P)-dependent dehydrogenase (short-subunit alcohol dehydrogenase family)